MHSTTNVCEVILPSLRGAIFVKSPIASTNKVCVILHGHGMTAQDMQEWLQELGLFQENMHFVFLQAPSTWYAPGSRFIPSWFTYVEEFDGVREDIISHSSLEAVLHSLCSCIHMALSTLSRTLSNQVRVQDTICAGFSEGGCVALELASMLPFKAVLTLVSHRRSHRVDRDLLCPWYALTATKDEVYSPPWALEHMHAATVWQKVEDDHYLHSSDAAVRDLFTQCFSEQLTA